MLQPAANPASRRHFLETMDTPVDLSQFVAALTSEQLEALLALFPTGHAPLWGVTRGKNDHNVVRYSRVAAGDPVLFIRQNTVFHAGVVGYTFRNAALAAELWSLKDGQPFELMYTVTSGHPTDIPVAELAAVAGFDPPVLGFRQLDSAASVKVADHFGLATTVQPEPIPQDLLDRASGFSFEGPVDDIESIVFRRAEQRAVRDAVLPIGVQHECDLCGAKLPRDLLVAAHVKRRSECSPSERRDVSNNVIRACRLGCDELFERGYIYITEVGRVATTLGSSDGYAFDLVNDRLLDRITSRHTASSREYFASHRARALDAV